LTYLTMARPDGLTTLGLVGGMGALLLSHAAMVWRGVHQTRPQTLVMVWAFVALALAWRFGEESLWGVLLTAGSLLLVLGALQRLRKAITESTAQDHHRALPGQLLTLHLGVMTGFFLTVALSPERQTVLTGADLLSEMTNLWLLTAMGSVSLFMYLQRLDVINTLVMPTLAAVAVLISMALAGQTLDNPDVPLVALLLFVLAGAYLAFQGDVRAGLKAVAAKDERLASFAEKRERVTQLVTSPSTDGSSSVTLKELDAELLELAERQKTEQSEAMFKPTTTFSWVTFTTALSFFCCSLRWPSSAQRGWLTPPRLAFKPLDSVRASPWCWWASRGYGPTPSVCAFRMYWALNFPSWWPWAVWCLFTSQDG